MSAAIAKPYNLCPPVPSWPHPCVNPCIAHIAAGVLRTPDTRSSGQGRRTPGPRKPPRESLGLQAVAQAGDCMAGRTTRWAVGGRGDERARRQEVCADEPRPPPPASEPPPHSTPRAHHPMPRLLLRYALPTTRSDPELFCITCYKHPLISLLILTTCAPQSPHGLIHV